MLWKNPSKLFGQPNRFSLKSNKYILKICYIRERKSKHDIFFQRGFYLIGMINFKKRHLKGYHIYIYMLYRYLCPYPKN